MGCLGERNGSIGREDMGLLFHRDDVKCTSEHTSVTIPYEGLVINAGEKAILWAVMSVHKTFCFAVA